RDIATKWLDWNRLGPIATKYQALIAADVKADTRKLDTFEAFESGLQALKTFVERRRAYLLSYKDSTVSAAVPAPSPRRMQTRSRVDRPRRELLRGRPGWVLDPPCRDAAGAEESRGRLGQHRSESARASRENGSDRCDQARAVAGAGLRGRDAGVAGSPRAGA